MEEKVDFNDRLLKLMAGMVVELKNIDNKLKKLNKLISDLSDDCGTDASKLRVDAGWS